MGTRAGGRRVAALVCAAAMLLTGCEFSVYNLPLPGGVDLGEDPYSVRVEFRDVLDLVPQSSVKVNDVSVGMVEDIRLEGYHAEVTLLLKEEVKLPDDAVARIRQTSLLGEKFVSLSPPPSGASSDLLQDGDVIPLSRSGRNPEVEEVLGAMSLLLNGGGVAQLKTIAVELNKALEGRESDVRSVLAQLDRFMGQLDKGKSDIIRAIESLNRLAISLKRQRGTIELTLDQMPAALASIDRQRDDLVKMLRALNELSAVGTEVIRQSKQATIDSLTQLDPILTKLAEAGDSFPKALQVFLTYPFVDAVVGENPAVARNLHMGDYTNLSVQMDVDMTQHSPLPELPEPPEPPDLPGPELPDPEETLTKVQRCLRSGDPTSRACRSLTPEQLRRFCNRAPDGPLKTALCGRDNDGDGGPLPTDPLPSPTLPGTNDGGLIENPLGGLGRAGPGATTDGRSSPAPSHTDDLAAMLVWGLIER